MFNVGFTVNKNEKKAGPRFDSKKPANELI